MFQYFKIIIQKIFYDLPINYLIDLKFILI